MTIAATGLLLLTGCGRGDGRTPVADETATQRQEKGAREVFVGTWTGPEGLSFVVAAKPDGTGYRVRNRDMLDTEQAFDAVRAGGTLTFVRRGVAQTARPGTGYKWLANKRDCLVVTMGVEGYCRD